MSPRKRLWRSTSRAADSSTAMWAAGKRGVTSLSTADDRVRGGLGAPPVSPRSWTPTSGCVQQVWSEAAEFATHGHRC